MPYRPRAAAFTLGELLELPELGLQLIAGAETAADAPVAGAHCIEIEHPSRWLAEDWIMLTTGGRLRGSARAQRELVDELLDAGCCALGLGLGLTFARVPTALLAQASTRGFPLVIVPLPTPFRAIVGAVQRALISAEIRSGFPAAPSKRLTSAGAGDRPRHTGGDHVEGVPDIDTRLLALRSAPHLHETLLAYLDNELDIGRTARAIGVHPNTLRYRIKRVEELVGGPLRRPEVLTSIHLAIRAEGFRSS
jgi:hypothetical protein